MKIRNKALAGVALSVGGKTVQGDEDGFFDVPEKNAKALLETPGWDRPKAGRPASVAPPAPEPEPEAPAPEPEPEPEAAEETEEVEEVVDLDALTKAELVQLADEQGVDVDSHARKAEIKDALAEALGDD